MRYKLFGRGTGLRVSQIALGTALFGTAWSYGAEPEDARAMFDAFAEAGGNFIDTADVYQAGQSETVVGECLQGRRDQFVLATKYTLSAGPAPHPSTTGNSRKSMVQAVEASLKRLKTDRIDVYWTHMPDSLTSADEIMRGFEDLVRAGKILYPGLSNFPAWRVARAATLAELRGWTPLAGLQIEYSLVERSGDRELLPAAEALGLGVAVWSPLGGGLLTGKYRRGETGRATTFGTFVHADSDARTSATLDALIAIAADLEATPGQVALAWLASRGVIPVIGPRTLEQLQDNLGAAELTLSPEQLARLDAASATPLGFPHDFLATENQRRAMAGGDPDAIEQPPVAPA